MLVSKYYDDNRQDKEVVVKVTKAIDSSPSLRNKKDLILKFIDQVNVNEELDDEWKAYIKESKERELTKIIKEENLKYDATIKYVDKAFDTGEMKSIGTDITEILPATSMFKTKDGISREVKKETVFQKLLAFFERFFGL
jgi:type I restriction enzyme R subunit